MFEIFKKNQAPSTGLVEKLNRNPQDVEMNIQKWLTEEQFETRKVFDERSNFRFIANRPGTPMFSVSQPKNKLDSILVESWITFNGVEKEKITHLFTQNPSILLDLRLQFESKGLLYNIQPPGANNDKPAAILFAKSVYFDGISKDRLLETALNLLHMFAFIALTIQRHLTSMRADTSVPSYLR